MIFYFRRILNFPFDPGRRCADSYLVISYRVQKHYRADHLFLPCPSSDWTSHCRYPFGERDSEAKKSARETPSGRHVPVPQKVPKFLFPQWNNALSLNSILFFCHLERNFPKWARHRRSGPSCATSTFSWRKFHWLFIAWKRSLRRWMFLYPFRNFSLHSTMFRQKS